jgi:hypothetical protein
MAKKNNVKPSRTAPPPNTLNLDDEKIPMLGITGRNPTITYPAEFELMNKMNVEQSAWFKRDKMNIIDSLKKYFHKHTEKKFVMKKIDDERTRIWRVEDGTKLTSRKSPKKRGAYNMKNKKPVVPEGNEQVTT